LTARRVVVSADDFGLSLAVNEAVEQAHRDGILSTASLMVAGAAADDAVARARRLPGLHVGLHVVVIEGPAVSPPVVIPRLVGGDGQFPSDQARLGVRYFFDPRVRQQLRAEIAAQFAAFAATGLRLDHANAHKHMHLHPTVGRMVIEEGARHGLPAIRIPAEPPAVMAALGGPASLGDRSLYRWTALLRRQARRAGLRTNHHVFGIGWSGHMTTDRLLRLAPLLPAGLSEIYFHPATTEDATLARLMPGYEHAAELRTLLDPAVAAALPERTTYASAG
jgi:hopanoid biosynthesis associated protein HpnK